MIDPEDLYDVYIEKGQKKVFAVAVHWPGWCRYGRDEESAMDVLVACARRYASIPSTAKLDFSPPASASDLNIIAHLDGDATTDFGAPSQMLKDEWDLLSEEDLGRYEALIFGCWNALDQAVESGRGKTLKKGPRGGGRDLEKIIEHVHQAERAYLAKLGWAVPEAKGEIGERISLLRREIFAGLQAAAAGELPRQGPRGGRRWPPGFFARRLAWHAVDHAWEIEDRIQARKVNQA